MGEVARSRRGPVNRVKELRMVPAAELRDNPKNWRRHPVAQRRALRALLAEIGYADALIAREETGELVLLDGHLRKSVSRDELVPVLVTDLSAEEGDKLLATLDPLAGLATADPALLSELLASVQTKSAAVRELLDAVARGAGVPVVRGRTDPDALPSIPATPRSKPADLWVLGSHRVLCGDARSPADLARLMGSERADLLWTDPPYGVDYEGKTEQALRIEGDDRGGLQRLLGSAFGAIDAVLRPGAPLYICHPAGGNAVVFAHAFVESGWDLRQSLVWVKDAFVLGHGDYHYRHEPMLYGYKPAESTLGRGRSGWHGGNARDSVFEIPRPRASREHPTAKPVELIRRCVTNSTTPDGIVLDPFLGSGSSVIACEQSGRICRGIELDPRYADAAVARWEAFTGRRATRARRGRR